MHSLCEDSEMLVIEPAQTAQRVSPQRREQARQIVRAQTSQRFATVRQSRNQRRTCQRQEAHSGDRPFLVVRRGQSRKDVVTRSLGALEEHVRQH